MEPSDPHAAAAALADVAREAGRLVAGYYRREAVRSWTKPDDSPVTEADEASHALLMRLLGEAFPGLPVLSEEGDIPDHAVRSRWRRYLCIDPLDGTKGFLHRTGDFCVSLALVEEGRALAGAIHLPVEDAVYWGASGNGGDVAGASWMAHGDGPPAPLRTSRPGSGQGLRVLCSRTRETPKLDAWLADKPVTARRCRGGAVKFCLLAAGEADVFPCLYPTWEWDAAAGQAIVEGAGGRVLTLQGEPMRYNKENLINPPFVAWG